MTSIDNSRAAVSAGAVAAGDLVEVDPGRVVRYTTWAGLPAGSALAGAQWLPPWAIGTALLVLACSAVAVGRWSFLNLDARSSSGARAGRLGTVSGVRWLFGLLG